MMEKVLTDLEVEAEIERLKNSEAVRLARKEQRIKYKRRQRLYTLRSFEKRGLELIRQGITYEELDATEKEEDNAED